MLILNKDNFLMTTIHKSSTALRNSKIFSFNDFRICFVLHGSATWEINGKNFKVNSGDVIFLNSSQKRRLSTFGEDGFSFVAFCLKRSAFSNPYHFLFFLNCIKKYDGVIKSHPFSDYLQKLYFEFQADNHLRYEMASALITEFFIKSELQEDFSPSNSVLFDDRLLNILDYIDANITEKLNLSTLAKRAGLTDSSFSRWFAKSNGVSFKKYIMSKRIALSLNLMQTTDLKMIDIALECGFESVSGFYDTFKKITGTTPREFNDVSYI